MKKVILSLVAVFVVITNAIPASALTLLESLSAQQQICIIEQTRRCYKTTAGYSSAHYACACGNLNLVPMSVFLSLGSNYPSYFQSCSNGQALNCSFAILGIAINEYNSQYNQCNGYYEGSNATVWERAACILSCSYSWRMFYRLY